MLQKLFSSKVRVEILSTFLMNPEKERYVREIARITGEDYKNVRRELQNLEEIGLLLSRNEGNLKFFGVNKRFVIYDELKSIFLKTKGAAAVLKEAVSKAKDIDYAFIYGSFAMGTERADSDIDLMVIGGISLEDVLVFLRGPEEQLSREINVSLYELQEIQRRTKDNDPFITEVLGGSKIMLIGEEDELRRALG
jgi:predicted nucleotidyltransferase/predicted transcriptional regulator with HTH domain